MAEHWHRRLFEGRATLFAVATTVAISIGGIVEIVPMFTVSDGSDTTADIQPYSPLEVAGRDIYVREGCYTCHSQMVRPFRAETQRFGEWSHSEEYKYDRPFQLGSRRIGPDLHRVGGKYPDAWHYDHMRDPRSTSVNSVMPPYTWLIDAKVDPEDIRASVVALKRVGTPYSDEDVANVPASMAEQAKGIVSRLKDGGVENPQGDTEIVALIAYLQTLGRNRPSLRKQANAGESK